MLLQQYPAQPSQKPLLVHILAYRSHLRVGVLTPSNGRWSTTWPIHVLFLLVAYPQFISLLYLDLPQDNDSRTYEHRDVVHAITPYVNQYLSNLRILTTRNGLTRHIYGYKHSKIKLSKKITASNKRVWKLCGTAKTPIKLSSADFWSM